MKQYICIEGTDWSGKTTVSDLLWQLLKDRWGQVWIKSKEPGSPHIPACQRIREIIINNPLLDDWAYAGLFAADARLHLEWVSKNNQSGVGVLSDRCMISDYAYRPNHGLFRDANESLFRSLDPVVIFLSASKETLEERCADRNDINPFEKEHVIDRLEEIKENYINALTEYNHLVIDTDGKSPEKIAKEALQYVDRLSRSESDTEGCVCGATDKKR